MQNPNSIIPLMSLLRFEADLSATLGPLTRGGLSRGPVTLKTLLLAPSVRCFPTFPRHAPTRLVTKNTSTQISIQTTLSKKKIPPNPYITDETTSPSHLILTIIRMAKTSDQVIALSCISLLHSLISHYTDPTRKSAHHPRRKEEAPRGDQSKASRDPEGSAREEGEGEEGMIDTHSTLSFSLKSRVGS